MEEDEYPAAEVCTELGPGGPVENIFGAILPTRVTALPKVSFLRSGWDNNNNNNNTALPKVLFLRVILGHFTLPTFV